VYEVEAFTPSSRKFYARSNGIYSVRTRNLCTKYRHLYKVQATRGGCARENVSFCRPPGIPRGHGFIRLTSC